MLVNGIGRQVTQAQLDEQLACMGITHPMAPSGFRLQQMLQPAKEIDVHEFTRLMFCGGHSPNVHLYEQLHGAGRSDPSVAGEYGTKYMGEANYYVFFSLGYALCAVTIYKREANLDGWFIAEGETVTSLYAHGVRFYRIGCAHRNRRHESPRLFEHHYICLDCGHEIVVDSSG
ncbi:MAG: hypothetical protein KC441_00600 [Anaerolineales bacterium]|nr:hypothetical protein [Anaerolineales bacterium]